MEGLAGLTVVEMPSEDTTNSISSKLKLAQAWNRQSVALMEQENLSEAAVFLKMAAIALSESSKSLENDEAQMEEEDKPNEKKEEVPSSRLSIESHGKTLNREASIFHRPFSFHVHSSEAFLVSRPCKKRKISNSPHVSSSDHKRCSVCCLFNAGLLFHLEWMNLQKTPYDSSPRPLHMGDGDKLLIQACHCYEKAFRLIQREPVARSEAILHVLMAICTNATECHLQLGNLDHAMVWNRQLCQLLAFSTFSISTIDFFLSSAFYNSFSRVAANSA